MQRTMIQSRLTEHHILMSRLSPAESCLGSNIVSTFSWFVTRVPRVISTQRGQCYDARFSCVVSRVSLRRARGAPQEVTLSGPHTSRPERNCYFSHDLLSDSFACSAAVPPMSQVTPPSSC